MEPSSAYAGLLACVVGIGLGLAAPLRETGVERERAAGIALERIATVGDYPPAGRRIVVNVDAEGRITFEGRRVPFEALVPALLPVVGRAGRAPDGTSTLTAVLRLDRSVAWRACAWLLQDFANPATKITRVGFAVRPEDGSEEGVLRITLPQDRCCTRDPNAPQTEQLRVRVTTAGMPVDPESLLAEIRQTEGARRAFVPEVEIDADVPTGYFLRTLDALHRAGARAVLFVGVKSAGPASFESVVQAGKGQVGKVGIFLDGRVVGGPPGGPPPRQPVARIRGREAGFLEEVVERDLPTEDPSPSQK